jgi:hypothetical protein
MKLLLHIDGANKRELRRGANAAERMRAIYREN